MQKLKLATSTRVLLNGSINIMLSQTSKMKQLNIKQTGGTGWKSPKKYFMSTHQTPTDVLPNPPDQPNLIRLVDTHQALNYK
jgi:hypothetical protein